MKILKPDNMAVLYRSLRFAGLDTLAIGAVACFRFGGRGTDALLADHEMWPLMQQALGKDAILDEGYPKPAGEYLVYGAACAPAGTRVAQQRVRVRLGTLSKSLVVSGDRQFDARGAISAPLAYERMPVEPATAYGGPAFADNPSGKGYLPDSAGAAAGPLALPNVERELHPMTRPGERATPAGFWGFGFAAPLRQQYLGTCDERWLETAWPHLPTDTRAELFMTAAQDQRLAGYFAGDEAFQIDNMHPQQRTQQGALPGLRARCFVNVRTSDGDALREVAAHAETVWLFPELECGAVLYRALVRCADDDASDVLHVKSVWEASATAPLAFEHYAQAFRDERAKAVKAKPLPAVPPAAEPAAAQARASAAAAAAAEQAAAAGGAVKAELSVVHGLSAQLNTETQALMRKYNLGEADIARYMKAVEPAELPATKLSDIGKLVEEVNAQTRALMQRHNLGEADIAKYMRAPAPDTPATFADVGKLIDALNGETRAVMKRYNLSDADLARHLQPDAATAAQHLALPGGAAAQDAFAALDVLAQTAPKRPAVALPGLPAGEAGGAPLTREDVIARHAAGQSLAGYALGGLDLAGLDLSGADFSGATLDKTSFATSRLEGVDFTQALLRGTDFSEAGLQRAQLGRASAPGSAFAGADLSGARLAEGDFTGADFSAAQLAHADLRGALFDQAKMPGVNASACRAERASFTSCDLSGAAFSGAALAKASFSGSQIGGCDFSQAACAQAEFYGAQAVGAQFADATLSGSRADATTCFDGARFTRTKLSRACWAGVQLRGATFEAAVLDHADFSKAQAPGAQFGASSAKGARFAQADLSGANLDAVNLFQGSLRKANVSGAHLRFANLYGVDFDGTQPTVAMLEGSNIERTLLQFRPPIL